MVGGFLRYNSRQFRDTTWQIAPSVATLHPTPMRYKVRRSNKDKSLHFLCGEGAEAFNALPAAIRHLGPWPGGAEGDINRLRLTRVVDHKRSNRLTAGPSGLLQ